MHDWDISNWTMHGFGWIIWIIVIALLVWFAVYLTSKNRERVGYESPLNILKKRYAQGEISKEEYEEKKKEIAQD